MTAEALRLVDEQGRRQPVKRKLTAAYCRKLATPSKGRITVYDTAQPRLAFVVTDKGSRAFYLVAKVNGRARRVRLCDGSTPVEKARKLAVQQYSNMLDGKDPVELRRQRRAQVDTLGSLWAFYQAERDRTPRTVTAEASLWANAFKSWEGRRLDAITPEQVAAKHGKLGTDRGRTTANRAVQLLRRLYRFAYRRRLYRGQNPAEGIDLYREQARERFVQPSELPGLLEAIDAEAAPWADYFRLLLLTGARRSALASMRWADLDLDAGTWQIPAEASKNRSSITVPLVAEAVERLQRRRAEANGSAYVFPSNSKTGHIVQPTGAWQRIRERAKLDDVTIHDLRRTCGSYLAAQGVALPIIGRALGHRSQQATSIYAKLDVDPVRRELDRVAATVSKATKQNDKSADASA